MCNRFFALFVLITAVYSFPTAGDEEKDAGDQLARPESYETLSAPETIGNLQMDDATYPRLRNARPTPFIPRQADSGNCPTGPSLNIRCDPKRPWPACPPQSYCYATNSVELGQYFCCPV